MKRVCQHSKGWWIKRLTDLCKDFKRAKRRFARRSDEANELHLKDCIEKFKKEEAEARGKYMEEMVPKKPGQFWKVVNSERKSKSKGVVQPIVREDQTLAVTDEEIFQEMKKRYGKETLDVKEDNPGWFETVEEEARVKTIDELRKIKDRKYSKDCENENSDIIIDEVQSSLEQLTNFSAPNPEEHIFNIMLKKGGDMLVKGLHYIFQKCWTKTVLPEAFVTDARIMLPKPDKNDYNSVRAYRPITLESVLGKVFERIVTRRLVWKLEVEQGIAPTQYFNRGPQGILDLSN